MKRNLFTRSLILFLGVLVILALTGQETAFAQKMKLKAASIYPSPDLPMHMGISFQLWMEEVTKRTKGDITFETLWGATLGPGSEHIELLRKGTVDVAQTFAWYTPGRFPLGSYTYVFPFTPTDPLLIVKANRKMKARFPQLRQDEEKQNVIRVCDPPGGPYDLMSRKPLKSIDDFKGEKVALIGRYFGRWLPPGATAVVRPMHERYELLQTGVVNIDFHPFTHFYHTKVYELVKNYTRVGAMAGFHSEAFVNLDVYKKLSPAYQKIFMEAGDYVDEKTAKELLPQWTDLFEKELKKLGVTFSDFPREEIKKWAGKLEDVPAEWADEVTKKGYPGFEFVKAWQDITSELGYQWPRRWGVKK